MYNIASFSLINICTASLGFGAFLCGIYALNQKSELALRALACTGSLIWAVYFWVTDSSTAAVIALIIGIRLLAAYKLLKQPRRIKMIGVYVFQIIALISTYYTWHGIASVAVFLAAALATYGYFLMSGSKLRILLVIVDCLWLLHDFITISIVHAIATVIQIVVNLRMTAKLKKDKNEYHA